MKSIFPMGLTRDVLCHSLCKMGCLRVAAGMGLHAGCSMDVLFYSLTSLCWALLAQLRDFAVAKLRRCIVLQGVSISLALYLLYIEPMKHSKHNAFTADAL